jgi:hypothetical protein
LSNDLPNSWGSIHNLRDKFYEEYLGYTQQSVSLYLEQNTEKINHSIGMMKKIIITLKDNKFFSDNSKIFKKYYVPYKFIISRLLYKFKDISLFNRHIQDIIFSLKNEILDVDIQTKLDCNVRNAVFQKKLVQFIDTIINNSFEKNKDKRLFNKQDITHKLTDQNNVCAHCGMSKENYEGDHIIPWSKGGKTVYDNLQVLCKDCHYKKSDE